MNKKIFIPALIVVVLVVVAGFLAARKGSEHPDEQTQRGPSDSSSVGQHTDAMTPTAADPVSLQNTAPVATPAVTETKTTAHFSSGEEADGVDVQVFEIAYDGSKFTPANMTIKAGDVIIFKNGSKSAFWPASNPHPAHTDYPEFDAKKPIEPGKTFEFKFTKVGKWGFHDHLNFTARGVLTVN